MKKGGISEIEAREGKRLDTREIWGGDRRVETSVGHRTGDNEGCGERKKTVGKKRKDFLLSLQSY